MVKSDPDQTAESDWRMTGWDIFPFTILGLATFLIIPTMTIFRSTSGGLDGLWHASRAPWIRSLQLVRAWNSSSIFGSVKLDEQKRRTTMHVWYQHLRKWSWLKDISVFLKLSYVLLLPPQICHTSGKQHQTKAMQKSTIAFHYLAHFLRKKSTRVILKSVFSHLQLGCKRHAACL